MSDVFNIINEVENLKSEIQSLKLESKYLRKKSEITPLIALYNHVRSHSLIGKNLVLTVTFYTRDKARYSYMYEKIIALNDSINKLSDNGSQKICNIEDITKVELASNYENVDKIFTYEFEK